MASPLRTLTHQGPYPSAQPFTKQVKIRMSRGSETAPGSACLTQAAKLSASQSSNHSSPWENTYTWLQTSLYALQSGLMMQLIHINFQNKQ